MKRVQKVVMNTLSLLLSDSIRFIYKDQSEGPESSKKPTLACKMRRLASVL